MNLKLQYFCFLMFTNSLGLHYEDTRCKCICPSPAAVGVLQSNNERQLFIADVTPNKCTCDEVVLPMVGEEVKIHVQVYCPRCECKFESRNPSVIMFDSMTLDITMMVILLQFVVVLLLWVLLLLIAYMSFLKFLHPLIYKKQTNHYNAYSNYSVYEEPYSQETENLLDDTDD